MLQIDIIGYIGADAEVKVTDGKEFTTFRVAHAEKYTDANNNVHESTQWVDCVMNGKPNVMPYLKRGTLVSVSGSLKTRVYSSAKDHCMKCGVSCSVRNLELLGGKSDAVPARLVDANGNIHAVTKWFYVADMVRSKKEPELVQMMSERGGSVYNVDRNGFVHIVESQTPTDNDTTQDPIF